MGQTGAKRKDTLWIIRYQDGVMFSTYGKRKEAEKIAEEKRPGIRFIVA